MGYRGYRRRSYRSYSYSRSNYYAPISQSVVLRQKASSEAMKFVRQAFFSLDYQRLERYFNQYAKEHGSSSASYARRTYPSWKCGAVGMSGQTATRILKIVPGILSRQDQLKLLEIYIPLLQQSLAETFRESLGNKVIPALELNIFYQKAEALAKQVSLPVDWFVKGVFTDEELTHFQEIIRFLLIQRLDRSFKNVVSDLIELHNACRGKPLQIGLNYQIAALGAQVELESAQGVQNLIFTPSYGIDQSKVTEDIRGMLLRHVADSLVQDEANQRLASGMQSIALNELAATLGSIEKADNPNAEAQSTLRIQAKGGTAVLEINKISIAMLRQNISAARFKQTVLLIVAVCIAILIINLFDSKRGGLVVLILLVGLPIGGSLWYSWKEEAESKQKQIDSYELAQRKVFAKK
jgi:hypothetical protein